ncbi:hypothetical protein [Microcella putealis]|uniref:hypothetical protein n=1 Tax=Microcella putealis TaxID=337005 RepID=UPI00115458CB|nr:hypothetical protein [Microcella putealis]
MKVKLTLARSGGPSSDVVITADAAATVADVAESLAERDPFRAKVGAVAPGDPTLAVVDAASGARRRTLTRDVPLAEARLGSGATIAVTSAGAPEHKRSATVVTLRVVEGTRCGVDRRACRWFVHGRP